MCEHLKAAAARKAPVKPSGPGCQECLATGDVWVNLRLCLACGHVGCCDDSPNRHATGHFKKVKHPVIRSYEPGEDWAYCYADDEGVEVFAARPGEAAKQHFGPP
jgi:uncharacterized UBP type Zn finger protein